MKHLTPINRKADRIDRVQAEAAGAGHGDPPTLPYRSGGVGADDAFIREDELDVVALQSTDPTRTGPHFPLGCSLVFFPGWEADSQGGTAGLCQPVERDLFDCHLGCFWPAHVPDQLNYSPDWTGKCASAQKDWRKIDLIFP